MILREKTVRQNQQQEGQQQEQEEDRAGGFLHDTFDSLKGHGGCLF